MELTKEYLDEQFKLNKRYLDKKLGELGKKFVSKEYFDKQLSEKFSTLATMILANQEDLAIVKTDVKEIKETLNRVNKRDQEDSNAFSKTLLDHGRRIRKLEKMAKSH